MMFAGFGVTIKDIPPFLQWGTYVSYLRYGLEGYVGAFFYKREKLECGAMYCHYRYFIETLLLIHCIGINTAYSIAIQINS
jgi:ABC-2 type transporter